MKRYEIILYTREYGTREGMDYHTLTEARKEVPDYFMGGYDGLMIYDEKENRIVEAYNMIPENHVAAWVDCQGCKMHYNYKPRNVGGKYECWTYKTKQEARS